MIGSSGQRMLNFTAPHMDSWNAWHDWFGNSPDGLADLTAAVDEAVTAAGRDPSEVERTTTILVQLTGGKGRGTRREYAEPTPPIKGTSEELAQAIDSYADVGISHVQLVLDPITVGSIEEVAPVLEILDRG